MYEALSYRWVSECDMRGAEPVTKEASLLKLHANLIKINKNKTNELDMSTVTQVSSAPTSLSY